MANPNSLSCRNIGWWRLVMVAACLAVGFGGKAQVVNDDCAGGLLQGVPILSFDVERCAAPFSTHIVDSLDFASVEFPFPMNPYPCSNFGDHMVVPGADRWYAFRVMCSLWMELSCTDTCQVSFWSSPSCATLLPQNCLTLMPGEVRSGYASSPPGDMVPLLDTMYLQISALHPVSDLKYELCLQSSQSFDCVSTGPAYHQFTDPTPVVCFTYTTAFTAASGAANADGTITVAMQLGAAHPYRIVWNDGDTSFARSGLAAGTYSFTITDAAGCTRTKSIDLPADPSTAVDSIQHADPPGAITYQAGYLQLPDDQWSGATYVLITLTGQTIATGRVASCTINVGSLAVGGYILALRGASAAHYAQVFISQ